MTRSLPLPRAFVAGEGFETMSAAAKLEVRYFASNKKPRKAFTVL